MYILDCKYDVCVSEDKDMVCFYLYVYEVFFFIIFILLCVD